MSLLVPFLFVLMASGFSVSLEKRENSRQRSTPSARQVFEEIEKFRGGVTGPNSQSVGSLSLSVVEQFTEEELECWHSLLKNMPPMDLDSQTGPTLEDLAENIRLALKARETFPWAGKETVPFEVFKNEVLPYAVIDELRERLPNGQSWRSLFFEKAKALLLPSTGSDTKAATSLSDAALALNLKAWEAFKEWGHDKIVFKSDQSPQIMSVAQVLHAGYASCTGLSIFLVNLCRAAGIPARMAGTPLWNTETGGNHSWVEIWTGASGGWVFTGAAEQSPDGFNRGWFFPEPVQKQIPGDKYKAIFATSWGWRDSKSGDLLPEFPFSWTDPKKMVVRGVDRTSDYLALLPPSESTTTTV
uniref:Transglutaminase-like domain-containing protein n=1 Tax=Chromera velia CCMP2878 TaxID=1169474 RepID=A0A0G4FMM1_9ALVE|mmetsp:Transcript_3144/g.6509  ORF Transcript_3144/g.6509 Transcript_3144/m.6509 type:complete len:358 (+) Transcript_3144:128-1201(+)|eukprot:Cvel_17814.t1-p1 / transcript=Cvel_17814.t1 / gene=Cvel_17814 / organism=Chromera_velia_CCMP2878 / gene_product=hypothetical protein / transcript_product=hypothetical protein / location=Cvel_scaffold1443:20749-24333(+) / protein_length=357 / sequence_SO=supercontig / SO=protein_coding / is_pseudo=false